MHAPQKGEQEQEKDGEIEELVVTGGRADGEVPNGDHPSHDMFASSSSSQTEFSVHVIVVDEEGSSGEK